MKIKDLLGLFLSKDVLQHAADPATPLSECLKTAMRGNNDAVITIGTIRDGRKTGLSMETTDFDRFLNRDVGNDYVGIF